MRDLIIRLAPVIGGGASAAAAAALGAGSGATAVLGVLGALAGAVLQRRAEAASVPVAAPVPAPVPTPRPEGGSLGQGVGRALIEQLPIGIVLLDPAGRIMFLNEKAAGFFGRRVPVDRNVSVIRVPALLDALARVTETGEAAEIDLRISRGRELDLHVHVIPLAEGMAGAVAGGGRSTLIVIEDHTRQRRAEQLQRDFVANASHELKTPLASILGFIETLQGHARHDEEARVRFLEIMAQQTMRMKRLVEDLLSLNRIELNEHVQPRAPQPIKRIVWEVAAALQPLAESRGVHIEAEPAADSPAVPGDRDELAQVFVNLIDNAMKYGDAGSEIRVHEAEPKPGREGMVGISVADQGPGIAREHLPRLTERFYRISVSRSRAKGGTGLGLAIVKHILTRHRGHLDVESDVGRGSVFTVWLPRHAGGASGATPGAVPVAGPERRPAPEVQRTAAE